MAHGVGLVGTVPGGLESVFLPFLTQELEQ